MMNSITNNHHHVNPKLRLIAKYLQDGSLTADQEKTAKALESLHEALHDSSSISENCVSACQLGATPELLLSIIDRHSTSAKIHKLGYELMSTMEYHTDLVCTKDLLQLSLLGMDRFSGDPKVSAHSTTTSILERSIISNGDDISAKQVGLLATLSAMKDSPNQVSIQRNGCIVLYRFIENKDDCGAVVKEGGIGLVIAAMQNERFRDTDLPQNGCRVLSELVQFDLEGHCRLIIEAGGLEALSKVVRICKFRNYPHYQDFAEMASKTIESLLRSSK